MLKRWYQAVTHSAGLLPPYVILILSLCITGLLTAIAFNQAHLEASQRFDRLSRQTINAINVRMNTYIDALLHTRGFFRASKDVDRTEFRDFVTSLDLNTRYPGIQGIGFARRLRPNELRAFAEEMKRAGIKNFHVWHDSSIDKSREEYFPVAYLEPLDWRNQRAIGYDMFAEPNRQEAMIRARDTGQPAATKQIVLVQEVEKNIQPGFLIYVPVYDRPASTLHTIAQRQQALIGFIYGPFRAADLFAEVSREMAISERRLDLEVFDGSVADRSRLYFDSQIDAEEVIKRGHVSRGELSAQAQLNIAGQPWTVVVHELPGFSSQSAVSYAWYVLIVGLIASLVGYRWSLTNARYNLAMLQSSRQLREVANQKTLVAEAIQTLSSSLNYRVSLRKLAELLTRNRADLCVITMLEDTQKPFHVCVSSKNHDFPAALKLNHPDGILSVARSGSSQFLADVDTPTPEDVNARPEWRRILQKAGVHSYLCIPIQLWNQNFGSMMLARNSAAMRYTKADLELARELAERAATAIENSKLYDEAKRVNRIKDEFLATLSHELRTPLNVIQGHAELLMSEAPPGELTESIEAIYRNAKAQTQIVDDLLDVSSIITGKISFHPQPVDIVHVIEGAVESVRFSAKTKQIQISTDFDAKPLNIIGDPTRLQQIIWNLLSNAIKFTPNQGRISISAKLDGNKAVIRVKDTGQGVDRTFLPDIFDRFRQEDGSMTRQFGGLGLGLSIVRSLVELHGGTVTAWSAGKGQGTEFKVSIPIATMDQRADQSSEPPPAQP